MNASVQALRQIYLFKDLSDEALAVVAKVATPRVFEPGHELCREGGASEGMFLIRSGTVRVTKGGSETGVVMLGSGSHFGELALVDDGPRSASVTAVERCDVLVVKGPELKQALGSRPEVGAPLYFAIAASIAKRLRATTDDLAFARQLAASARHIS